ncbi:MAG: hypothetical protein ACTXOO_04580 [Sodalis sp. (in: enterobacteria)]
MCWIKNFYFPMMIRNINYIEWLVDSMLRVLAPHILDVFYLADCYDTSSIGTRLDAMTPQHALIWFIS